MAKTGYCNGSDMLLYIGGKAVGHCTSHKVSYKSETKERAVKPIASAGMNAGKWKEKVVTGLSISISADGLIHYEETESGFKDVLGLWKVGQTVDVKCMERGASDTPYLEGKFIIDSIDENQAAVEDATYSISLSNCGEPTTFDESKFVSPTV